MLPGSLGTTSTRSSAKRERRRSANSMQLAIGWSSRTLISPSETASDTSRCALCRETPSFVAIWSWVLPAT